MVQDADYEARGLPISLLGWSWKTWHLAQMRKIVNYYSFNPVHSHLKILEFELLNRVVQTHNLRLADRWQLLAAEDTDHIIPNVPQSPRFQAGEENILTPSSTAAPSSANIQSVAALSIPARADVDVQPLIKKQRLNSSESSFHRPSTTARKPENDVNRIPTERARGPALGRTCTVCDEALFENTVPSRRITSTCDHILSTCLDCLSESIRSQFENRMWNQIGCPHCNEHLQFEDMRAWAPMDIFTRYDKIAMESALGSDQEYRACANRRCNNGGYCNPRTESFFTCYACQHRTCLGCRTLYHEGLSCAEHLENQEREAKEEAAREAARKAGEDEATKNVLGEKVRVGDIKTCPNQKCGGLIKKNGGCDHMTCRQCRLQFCWVCLTPWAPIISHGNAHHGPTCKYHTENLTAGPAIPRVANVRPTINRRRRRIANIEPAIPGRTANIEPAIPRRTASIKPVIANVEPAIANIEPVIANVEPVIANFEPAIPNRRGEGPAIAEWLEPRPLLDWLAPLSRVWPLGDRTGQHQQ